MKPPNRKRDFDVQRLQSAGAGAFTLIEVMLAVLILALLSTAAAMSLSQPMRVARSQGLLRQLKSFDAAARHAAVASGKELRMVFDLSNDSIARFDGTELGDLHSREHLPTGYSIDQIRLAGHSSFSDAVPVDVSELGFSRSYALHLRGPSFNKWILFAGLSGDMTSSPDDTTTDAMLAKATSVR